MVKSVENEISGIAEIERWLEAEGIITKETIIPEQKTIIVGHKYNKNDLKYIASFIKTLEDRKIFKNVFEKYYPKYNLTYIMSEAHKIICPLL